MLDFIAAPYNQPFALALFMLLCITLLEGADAIFHAGILSAINGTFTGAGNHASESPSDIKGFISQALSWLHIGDVPPVISVVIFLSGFSISGMSVQALSVTLLGYMLPAVIAAVPACIIAFLAVHFFSGVLRSILVKQDVAIVADDDLIGHVAVIAIGESRKKNAAQGKVTDNAGNEHYIMIEPEDDSEIFLKGCRVMLIRRKGSRFFAIRNTL